MAEQFFFYLFAAISVISALLAITRKNPIISAVWLVGCMISLAVIYVLTHAFFLAAVQVIVYAGAILMLFIFVIMMLNLKTGIIGQMRNLGLKIIGLIITAVILRQFYTAIKGTLAMAGPASALPDNFGEASALGELLFSSYVYPLELMAVLLLVAIVGALVLAGKEGAQ
ncbi:MAG TPA: NADH-quinone oxidoreductase subunit J [Candidatus Glassbacteria bacterium]|nr:NADH-quinone oxidoreductase subunit J [Candidatus Glassbacteria bacterium]